MSKAFSTPWKNFDEYIIFLNEHEKTRVNSAGIGKERKTQENTGKEWEEQEELWGAGKKGNKKSMERMRKYKGNFGNGQNQKGGGVNFRKTSSFGKIRKT